MRFLLLFIFSTHLMAQTAPSIRTGRPGQSIGPYAVGKNIIQLQTGYQFDDNIEDSNTINNVVRYGITERFEISGVFDLKNDSSDKSGVDNIQIGGRVNILDSSSFFVKSIGLQARTRFKGNGDYKKERQSYIATSAIEFQNIGDMSSAVNIQLQTNGTDPYIAKFITLNLSHPINEKFGVFVEPYLLLDRATETLSINAGASYLSTNDLAFDFSAGKDLSEGENKFFSLGFSIRR